MRRRRLTVAAAVSTALFSATSSVGTALAVQPNRGPVAPGRSVTTTLYNDTPCTLQLTGGTIVAGHLTQDVPLVIGPHTHAAWKITGLNAFGPARTPISLVIFAVTSCSLAGAQESYTCKIPTPAV